MTDEPSKVFTQKVVVDQITIYNSSNVCRTIVGIDASKLYSFSRCQETPKRIYTRWEYESKTDRSKARHNRTRNFENMVVPFYQELRPECKIEN